MVRRASFFYSAMLLTYHGGHRVCKAATKLLVTDTGYCKVQMIRVVLYRDGRKE